MIEIQNGCFGHLDLGFWDCLEFRISCLGFLVNWSFWICTDGEILNSNIEILNKFKYQMTEI